MKDKIKNLKISKANKKFSAESCRIVGAGFGNQMDYIWPFPRIACKSSDKIELLDAGDMGLGAFAVDDIKEGEYLCCYIGNIMHIPEIYSDYIFNLKLPNNIYSITIDSLEHGNISRFFNHSNSPNCRISTEYHYHSWQESSEKPYSPDKSWQYIPSKDDENRYYYYKEGEESVWEKPKSDLARWPLKDKEEPHICFHAARDIKKGEQLFIDYGKSYWETRGTKPE